MYIFTHSTALLRVWSITFTPFYQIMHRNFNVNSSSLQIKWKQKSPVNSGPFIWGTVTVSVVFQGSTPRSRSHSNTLYQWYYKISDLWTSLKSNNMMLATTTHQYRWTTETVPGSDFQSSWEQNDIVTTVVCVFWALVEVLKGLRGFDVKCPASFWC